MGKGRNPFAGKRVPTSNTKATQIPSTGKKKKGQAGGDNAAAAKNGGGGGGKKGKRAGRSFLGLVAAGAGFAALWAWSVWSRTQQSSSDRDVLQGMLRRPLAITEHAACRMDCRFIGRPEIEETLRKGRVNARKSDPALRPCPKYAVDATVGGMHRKNVQGVFAACPHETRVITVIDRDTNWACGPC